MNVLQLRKQLATRPELPEISGIVVRNYAGRGDISRWSDLLDAAFTAAQPPVRRMGGSEFSRQFQGSLWWSAKRMWFAETNNTLQPVGTVTLGLRQGKTRTSPAVHWLAVLPSWRRLGVARLLMAHLEQSCWDAGFRQVDLETHRGWRAAKKFYQTLGYRNTLRSSTRTKPDASKRIASG
jgi:GNAT superfamily N-acetyltransferase